MAPDAANRLNYYLLVPESDREHLAGLRHWEHLKVAQDGESIWVSNIQPAELEALAVKSIPRKQLFYAREGKLFPLGSLLPQGHEPAMLWTPIRRALPLQIQEVNHNYFGTEESLAIRLVPTEEEKESAVLYCSLEALEKLLDELPEFRLTPIRWTVINQTHALLFGQPFLPLEGKAYHIQGNSLFPAGYAFDLLILEDLIHKSLDPEGECWLVWNEDSSYFRVEKEKLKPLSRASLRETLRAIRTSSLSS